jgi:flavodoxin
MLLLLFFPYAITAQVLPGFRLSRTYNEQQMIIEDSPPGTRILINAPLIGFGKDDQVLLVFYALPNGNTIEQTFGKRTKEGDDWHFNIQHIAGQTRFLRKIVRDRTIVVAYLETKQKSWPAFVASTPGSVDKVKKIVDDVSKIFSPWQPKIVLNGHSGGGRFIFSYINSVPEIPAEIERIAFLDSSYGYEDTLHGPKLLKWLKADKNKFLCTLAYNDSVVIYNGKPLVSSTGGTWYRSKMIRNYLSGEFRFSVKKKDSLQWNSALGKRIEIILKTNPAGRIYHTEQVEFNGFIHSMLSGTRLENKGYRYFGPRVYSGYISDSILIPIRRLNIPPRDQGSVTGSEFIKRVADLPLNEREEEIYKTLSAGNVPDFLRKMVTLTTEFPDSAGVLHKVTFEVMPDYLSVGSDSDFCRIPMNPYTAQRLASEFGASMITSKLSDFLYQEAEVKLNPYNYIPVGNENELVTKFREHNSRIEAQLKEAGGYQGQLVAGIKKDVILSRRIAIQPGKVVIYGWHKPDGIPIQPVYSGHVWWYVDYSHGIRLINNQVLIDGRPCLLTDILRDPLLYTIFSDEDAPMDQVIYRRHD